MNFRCYYWLAVNTNAETYFTDEPVVMFQRNVFLTLEDELKVCKIFIQLTLYINPVKNVL